MIIKRTRVFVTAGLFGALFLMSQDYWTWSEDIVLGPLGLPRWVYLFAVLQIGVAAVVAWHIRRGSGDS